MGSLVLVGAWLLLQFLSRHGRNLGSNIARSLRRPILIGLGLSLYGTWGTHWMNKRVDLLEQELLNRLAAALVIVTISWALLNVGNTILNSASMRRWLQMEDEQDEAENEVHIRAHIK